MKNRCKFCAYEKPYFNGLCLACFYNKPQRILLKFLVKDVKKWVGSKGTN